ncbi:MAG: DNA-3-methyladenine glycosylase [Pararhodobacter sp.]
MIAPLPAAWFDRPAPAVARDLIGTILCLRGAVGILTETEAYAHDDPASHSFPGPRPRNAAMFGPPGRAYVYRAYGIHWCLNVVCARGDAVLLRAMEPRRGLALMATRRGTDKPQLLTTGPGRLGQALGIGPQDNHLPFDRRDFCILPGAGAAVLCGPRIGISRAADYPWRFGLAGSAFLSRPFGRATSAGAPQALPR